jgi:hypothetical protein
MKDAKLNAEIAIKLLYSIVGRGRHKNSKIVFQTPYTGPATSMTAQMKFISDYNCKN